MWSVIPKPGVVGFIICSDCGAEIDVKAALVAALNPETSRINIGTTLDLADLEMHMAEHGVFPEEKNG